MAQKPSCPECGYPLNGDENSCPECGHPMQVKKDIISAGSSSLAKLWNDDLGNYIYESFKIMENTFINKFWCFSGRATRREFWSFALLWWIIPGIWITSSGLLLLAYGLIILATLQSETVISFLAHASSFVLISDYIALFIGLIPFMGVYVRRLHDNNRSGWYILIPTISIFYMFQKNNDKPNEFGKPEPPKF